MPQTKRYKKRSTNTRYVNKKVKGAPVTQQKLVSMIKNINLKEAELKFKNRVLAYGAMNHNGIYKIPIWDIDALVGATSILPLPGVTDNARVGNRIHALKIKLRLQMDVPFDRKNVKVKLFFLEYNNDVGDPTDKAQLFHTVTGKTALDPIQVKRWGKSLRYLGTYTPQLNTNFMTQTTVHNLSDPPANEISANTASIMIKKDILLNRKIFFKSTGEMTPANLKENGVILALPFATSNTATSDNVVLTMSGASTLYFKDL